MQTLRKIISRNRSGEAVALPSVCSAHPDVLTATLLMAKEWDLPLLVEATSNQVNQHGGYTGMNPANFVAFVHRLCDAAGVERERVLFGGDHLGPQAWRQLPAESAMSEACTLVEAYVRAGFTKIHLDCSEGCQGEHERLGDSVVASRAAQLASVCEQSSGADGSISYIVGTEVPPPGGARAGETAQSVAPTDPAAAEATIKAHRRAFDALGIADAFARTVALVVQPGLEFAPDHVMAFDASLPDRLSPVIEQHEGMAFEAHSTDYQEAPVFKELARRHFAILKVGPALTFACRQAYYALDAIDHWVDGNPENLPETMEALMLAKPAHWTKHYEGDETHRHLMRHFGYADRIRYYWPEPRATQAVGSLIGRLNEAVLTEPLVLQYFSPEVVRRAHRLQNADCSLARALVLAQIQEAFSPYMACQA